MLPPEHQRRRPGEPLDNDESKEDSICVVPAGYGTWAAMAQMRVICANAGGGYYRPHTLPVTPQRCFVLTRTIMLLRTSSN